MNTARLFLKTYTEAGRDGSAIADALIHHASSTDAHEDLLVIAAQLAETTRRDYKAFKEAFSSGLL